MKVRCGEAARVGRFRSATSPCGASLGLSRMGCQNCACSKRGLPTDFADWPNESVPKVAAGVAAGLGPPQCFNFCERRRV